MPGVPGVKHIEGFRAACFTYENTVRSHTQDQTKNVCHGDVNGGVILNKILRGALQFARIFDNADTLVWKLTNYFSNDGV